MSEPSGCCYCGAENIEGRTNHWECGSSFSEKGGPLQGLICRISQLEQRNALLEAKIKAIKVANERFTEILDEIDKEKSNV